jgi:hypothetical protein
VLQPFNRKNGLGRALNEPPTLLTDRGAYVNFLEIQLERVSAACLGVQGYDDKINDLHAYITSLEQRCMNNTKLVDIAQQCTLELRSENDVKHKALADSVHSEHLEMQKLIQAMSARIACVEQSISILPLLQSRIDGIDDRIDKIEQRQSSFEAASCNRDDEVGITLEGLREDTSAMRASINDLNTAVSKQSFELKEAENRFKISLDGSETAAKVRFGELADEMSRRHEAVLSEMHYGFDKVQTDSASRESGCLAALRLHKESSLEEFDILKSVISKRQDAAETKFTEQTHQLWIEVDTLKSADNALGSRITSVQNDISDLKVEVNNHVNDNYIELSDAISSINVHMNKLDEMAGLTQRLDRNLRETSSSLYELDEDVSNLETLVQVLRNRLEDEILCEPIPISASQPTRRHRARQSTVSRNARLATESVAQSQPQYKVQSSQSSPRNSIDRTERVSPTRLNNARFQVQKNDNAVGVALAESSRYETLLRSTAVPKQIAKHDRLYGSSSIDAAISAAVARSKALSEPTMISPGSRRRSPSPQRADVRSNYEGYLTQKSLSDINFVDVERPMDYVGAGLYSGNNSSTRLRSSSLESDGTSCTARKSVAFAPVIRNSSPPVNKQRLGYIGAGIYWDSTQPFDKHLVSELLEELHYDVSDGQHIISEQPISAAERIESTASCQQDAISQSKSSIYADNKSSTISEGRSTASGDPLHQVMSSDSSSKVSSKQELRRSQSDSFVTRKSNASLSNMSDDQNRNASGSKRVDRTASTVSTLTPIHEPVNVSVSSNSTQSETIYSQMTGNSSSIVRTPSSASIENAISASAMTRSGSDISKTTDPSPSSASGVGQESDHMLRQSKEAPDEKRTISVTNRTSSSASLRASSDSRASREEEYESDDADANIFHEDGDSEGDERVSRPNQSLGSLSINIPGRALPEKDATASTIPISLGSSCDSHEDSSGRNSSPIRKLYRNKGNSSPPARLLMRPESYYLYDPSEDLALKEALAAPHSSPKSPIPWVPTSKLIPGGLSPMWRSTSDPDLKHPDHSAAVAIENDSSIGDSEPCNSLESIPLFSSKVSFPGAKDMYKHKRHFIANRKSSLKGSAVQVKSDI